LAGLLPASHAENSFSDVVPERRSFTGSHANETTI
jgi:hypothetical protein